MTLREAITRLSEAGVSSPEYDARLIYRELGGIHDILLFNRDAESDRPEVISAVERRATGEPLQYILGSVGFYREEYKVSPACLIPREDTEVLVDYAVKNLPEGGRFIDLCTGSGCIAISTLKNTRGTTAVAVDVSRPALRIAKENAALNGVSNRLTLTEADLTEGLTLSQGEFDAVLSNPPYVSEEEYAGLERELMHEPKIALSDGGDGSRFYKLIVPMAKELIKKDGFIAMEIGHKQAPLLRAIAEENHLLCEILTDLSGNDRVAVMRLN